MSTSTPPEEVAAYLEALPTAPRTTLEAIRQTIRSLVPDATEAISYGIPAFKYKGRSLAGYAAYKAHCSYFPMSGGVIEALKEELAGYATSKGGFKFPIGQPPPSELIEKLLNARMAEIDSKQTESLS